MIQRHRSSVPFFLPRDESIVARRRWGWWGAVADLGSWPKIAIRLIEGSDKLPAARPAGASLARKGNNLPVLALQHIPELSRKSPGRKTTPAAGMRRNGCPTACDQLRTANRLRNASRSCPLLSLTVQVTHTTLAPRAFPLRMPADEVEQYWAICRRGRYGGERDN